MNRRPYSVGLLIFLPLAASLIFAVIQAYGAIPDLSLRKAIFKKISGEVMVRREMLHSDSKAGIEDVLAEKGIIHTGKKSHADLEFGDKSVCRLGSNTFFSFDPSSRNMAISQGVLVVHVPPGKGGAVVATPSAIAVIRGDTLVCSCYQMKDGTPATKFTVLSPRGGPMDGNIQIVLTKNSGVSFPMSGGQMALVSQNTTARSQVTVVEIDVGSFVEKSPLLQHLPITARIEMNLTEVNQEKAFALGVARLTEFSVFGLGDQMAMRANVQNNPGPGPANPMPAPAAAPAGTIPLTPGGAGVIPECVIQNTAIPGGGQPIAAPLPTPDMMENAGASSYTPPPPGLLPEHSDGNSE